MFLVCLILTYTPSTQQWQVSYHVKCRNFNFKLKGELEASRTSTANISICYTLLPKPTSHHYAVIL